MELDLRGALVVIFDRLLLLNTLIRTALMAELKTKQNNASVTSFVKAVENDERRADAKELLILFRKVTSNRPKKCGATRLLAMVVIITNPRVVPRREIDCSPGFPLVKET